MIAGAVLDRKSVWGDGLMYHTEIRVRGRISRNWSEWFGELRMQESPCDDTRLLGDLPDMVAVYGIIFRLGSLVIPLISVNCLEEPEPRASRPDGHR